MIKITIENIREHEKELRDTLFKAEHAMISVRFRSGEIYTTFLEERGWSKSSIRTGYDMFKKEIDGEIAHLTSDVAVEYEDTKERSEE